MSYNTIASGSIMTELSIHLNRLSVGSYSLDSQQISPVHRRRAELSLSKILSKQQISTQGKEIPFHLRLYQGRPVLQIQDREISLEKSGELSRVSHIVRFYQHTGHFPRAEMSPQDEAFRVDKTKKAVRAINDASIPGSNGSILAGMRIAEDSLSLTRNILFAIPAIGANDPVVNHLGYYAGIFWTFFAFRELDEGWAEYKRSKVIGDTEGQRRSETRLLSGGICSTASLIYLAGRICDTFSSTAFATAAFGSANALFGVGSVIAMGSSILGAMRCYRFNARLNEYLENPKLTKVQGLQGALQFLKDAVSVTPEERAELVDQIEKDHPDWSAEQKEKLLQQKLTDLTEVKVKYIKRRTSNKSLCLILNQADALLAKLADPESQVEGIQEAAILLCTIQKENRTKMLLYILGFIASLISISAVLIATFLTAGALPFVLYGIAGTIYLVLTLYSAAGLLLRKDPDCNKNILLHPMQDLAAHG